ncbi:hypothetical protein SEVIR_8G187033v4 [Setaria viridis]|uniref:Uncharacterized protein n=1 Tax=Setaria viridis TaxID=4556 RepID=A0A4U6TLX2_SETVI|nr:hypothetical protein SEVIR_8G187033v2 [Setaria viridis]
MGMVCFKYGDAHRLQECRWSNKCSICGQDHKDLVCRKNPEAKLNWELVSSSAPNGAFHMMAAASSTPHLPTPPPQQYLPAPTPQYLATLVTPSAAPTLQTGAYWMPHATPSAPMVPWAPTPTGPTLGASSSSGVPGAYVMPTTNARDRGDVVTGIISVDSYDAHALFLFWS